MDPATAQLQFTGKGLHEIVLSCSTPDAGPIPRVTIYTADQQSPFPSEAAFGVTLPSGASCSWSIMLRTAFANADDAAQDGVMAGCVPSGFAILPTKSGAAVPSSVGTFTLK